jgi:galactonate dehydratase
LSKAAADSSNAPATRLSRSERHPRQVAEAYEVNVAPYNFNGHLGSLISADMCAVVPNFKVMEIDIEEVIWKVDIVTHPSVIENGDLVLP